MGDARVLSRAAGGGGGVGCRASGISLTYGVDFFENSLTMPGRQAVSCEISQPSTRWS